MTRDAHLDDNFLCFFMVLCPFFGPSCKSKGSGSFGGSKEAMIIIEPMQVSGWLKVSLLMCMSGGYRVFYECFFLIIVLFLAVLYLCCCAGFCYRLESQRCSLVAGAWDSHCGGFSCQEHGLWGTQASAAVAPGLQSTGSAVVVPRLSGVCGIFLEQRSNPRLLHRQANF